MATQLGPSAWLIWGTLATDLRRRGATTWQLGDLAEAHGIGHSPGRHGPVRRTLRRLAMFRLLSFDNGQHLVRVTAPPLTLAQLSGLPSLHQSVHAATYDATPDPIRD